MWPWPWRQPDRKDTASDFGASPNTPCRQETSSFCVALMSAACALHLPCLRAAHASGGPSPWQSCGGLAWDSSDEGCEPQKECMNQLCRHWHSAAQHSFVKALKRVKRRAQDWLAAARHAPRVHNRPSCVALTHKSLQLMCRRWQLHLVACSTNAALQISTANKLEVGRSSNARAW